MAFKWLARLIDRASRVRNDSSVAGDTVKDALEALDADIAANGDGDFVGPASSTNDAVVVFDGTTGKLGRNSEVIIHEAANDKLQTNATYQAWTTAADGSTVTFDLDQSDQHQVTFAGNRILAIDNESLGQTIHLLRIQDGTGNRVETWFSNISWNHGFAPVQDPTAAGWDLVTLKCRAVSVAGSPGTPAEWVEVCRTSSAPRKGITTVTCAATTTFDLRKSHKQKTVLDRNPTLELQAGSYYTGQPCAIQLVQDGTGSRTATFGASFGTITWTATGGVAPVLPTTAGASCWLVFLCTNSTGPTFECVGETGVLSSVVSDTAYDATSWNGVTDIAPSKNAVRDKFETLGTASVLASDTDGTLAANSDVRVATQKAVKTYVDTAVTGLLDYKGATDCSANPNYPAASKGDLYIVSVAGKIGGASGQTVEALDVYIATVDNAGGTEASVGTSWTVIQGNISAGFTGSGLIVKQTSPTLVTPTLGVASATSLACPTFTSAAAIGFTPAAGSGFNVTLSGAGDFCVNTNQLYVDTSTGYVGFGTAAPAARLDVATDLVITKTTGYSTLWLNGVTGSARHAKLTKNYDSPFEMNFYNSLNTTNVPLYFFTDDGTAGARLAIAATGYVSIGAGSSPSALCHIGASTTARASLCVPHGTAPTSPVNGDIWTTTAGLFVRINGVTKTVTLT